ncbi:MAG: hypothetical protein ACFFDS_08425 [Candidatus Thorarchaeota archaeon]
MTIKPAVPILILAVSLSACLKDPDPLPQAINTYQYYYNYLLEAYDLQWEIDGQELGTHSYGYPAQAIIQLDTAEQEVLFRTRNPETGSTIDSLSFTLYENQAYMLAMLGTEEEAHLLCEPMDTRYPTMGMVKYRFLNAVPGLGPVDVYAGGDLPENKVISGAIFPEVTEYYESTEMDMWESVIITPANILPEDSVLLSYTVNTMFQTGWVYLCTINHIDPDTTSSIEMQVFDQPIY